MPGHNNILETPRLDKYLNGCEKYALKNVGSLSIFPEEVWEYILNCIPFSTDIHAVLLAFPELDRCFHEKKVIWMFDQVLPQLLTKNLVQRRLIKMFVFNWMDSLSEDVLKLRLVSKRWKIAVDLLLQNQVERNSPQKTESVTTPVSLVPTFSFNNIQMTNFHFGTILFNEKYRVEEFIQQMSGLDRNPFPGKSIYLRPRYYGYISCNSIVEKCVELFETFGKYVTSLEIHFCGEEHRCHLDLCRNILKCLVNVPNLKILTISGRFDFHSDKNSHLYFRHPSNWRLFPDLPKLQTFDLTARMTHGIIGEHDSAWIAQMLHMYGRASGVRKLGTDQHAANLPHLLPFSPGLTELHLTLDNDLRWNDSVICNILQNLPNSRQLQTLSISTTTYFQLVLNITELISLLASFEVRNLILENVHLDETFIRNPSMAMSITSLHLMDDLKLSYEFLKLLPNLQTLKIYFNEFKSQKGYESYKLGLLKKPSLVKKLKTYFQKDRHSVKNYLPIATRLRACLLGAYINDSCVFDHLESIWTDIPSLKMLTGSLEVQIVPEEYHYGIWDVHFARECKNNMFLGEKPKWLVINPNEILFFRLIN